MKLTLKLQLTSHAIARKEETFTQHEAELVFSRIDSKNPLSLRSISKTIDRTLRFPSRQEEAEKGITSRSDKHKLSVKPKRHAITVVTSLLQQELFSSPLS